MANLPISGLTASAANLAATDVLPVVQTTGVGPVKMTGLQIKTGIIGAGSVSIASGKTFTSNNTLTLAGTDSTTMTFPSTSATIARTDAGQTFTGTQTAAAFQSNNFFDAGGNYELSTSSSTGLGLCLSSGYRITWFSGAIGGGGSVRDLFLTRGGTATLQLGAADAAAPVAQTLQVQSVVAGTSNTAGTNWTLKGSAGTGTGAGGSIIFQTAAAGSSGTSQNTFTNSMTLTPGTSGPTATISRAFITSYGTSAGTGQQGMCSLGYDGTSGVLTIGGPSGILTVSVAAGGRFGFSSGSNSNWADIDTTLYRDAANTLALRNGTNAQTFRVYNTYTDATINEYGTFDWSTSSNVLTIGAAKTGSGTVRSVKIVGGNSNNQSITLSNSNSIDLFAGGSNWMTVSPAGWTNPVWTGGTPWTIGSQGDEAGNPNRVGSSIRIQPKGGSGNGAAAFIQLYTGLATTAGTTGHTSELCVQTFLPETGKPGLQFGGTTSSFPALKRSSATLQVRLADDSGDAALTCAALTASGPIATSSDVRAGGSSYFYWLNKSQIYSPADGNIALINYAATGFSLLQFGGTTSSFPALKRSSATLQVRLADDSANAALESASVKTDAPAGGTSGTWKLGVAATVSPTSPNRTIEVDIGGTIYYIAAKTTND